MRLPSWLRPLAARLNRIDARPTLRRPNRRARLRIERLEDRVVPATMLTDINPSGNGIVTGHNSAAVVNGTAFFAANDGVHGLSLWKTDGTPAGTAFVKVIDPNDPSGLHSSLENFYSVNGRLVFDARDPVLGLNLWTSDGTAAGTVPLAAAAPTATTLLELNEAAVAGGVLYFPSRGTQLWKSDGTEAGTMMIKDLDPAQTDRAGEINSLSAFGSKVLFQVWQSGGGTWISDGTDGGTVQLINGIVPASGAAVLNGDLYFGGYNPVTNKGSLWKTDGTVAGTVQVSNVAADSIVNLNGILIFNGYDPAQTWPGIYRSDGTAAGTVPLELPFQGIGLMASPTVVGGYVLFAAGSDYVGTGLFRTDGTAAGTGILVKDINPNILSDAVFPFLPIGSYPADFAVVDGRLFFTADDGTHGREIWSSDGTELGTFLAQDINPGSASSQPASPSYDSSSSLGSLLIPFGSALLFAANDGVHGLQLWSSVGDQTPTASATPPTQTVAEGTPVEFDASASSDPNGDNLTYLWDFDGYGVFDASGAHVSHAFTADGVYPVTLKVVDGFGLSATTTVNVTVTEVQPTAIISSFAPPATDASGNWTSPEGLGIPLNGALTDPNPLDLQSGVNFIWDLTRNGAAYQSATGRDHWFAPDESGTYFVTLTVTDEDGSSSASQIIDVTGVAPAAHLRMPADLAAPPAGALDPNFGSGGEVVTDTTGYDFSANALAQQPDGKIVAAGYVLVRYDWVKREPTQDNEVQVPIDEFAIARYLPDGTPDTSFGQDGMVVTDFGLTNDTDAVAYQVVLQPDGKLLIVGNTTTYANDTVAGGITLLQLNPDGTPDTSFGPDHTGVVFTPGAPPPAAVTLQGGNILVAGNTGSAFALSRYTAAGLLDPTFGPDGTGTVQFQPNDLNGTYVNGATAMVLQGNQIYLAGLVNANDDRSQTNDDFFAVIRLDADGHLDTSYGGAAPPAVYDPPGTTFYSLAIPGWALAETPYPTGSPPTGMVVQPDRDVVLVGNYGLFRFTGDGSSGALVLNAGAPLPDDPSSITAQPDGKLLVSGAENIPDSGTTFTVLTRLNPDLSPDTAFGSNGDGQAFLSPSPDPSVTTSPYGIFLQSDGNVLVLVAVYSDSASYNNFSYAGSFLARFIGQGTPGHTVYEGDTVSLTGSATEPSGGYVAGLTYSWAVTKNGAPYQSASGQSYQFTPDDNGTYVVALTVADKDGDSSTDSHTFSVANVPPTTSVSARSSTAVAGEVLTFTLGASDPSPVDQAAGFIYRIDWGDGTVQQTVPASSGNGSGVSVTHSFAQASTYTVQVTATDKDGETGDVSTATVPVNAVTASNLQQVVSPSNPVTIQVNSVADATTVVRAINYLSSQGATVNGTVSLDLAPITYGGLTVNVPGGMTLVIGTANYTGGQQATIDPAAPAFTVVSGNVIVSNVTFVTTGDAPTILVQGGSLTLRNDTIEESSTGNGAAIAITGGTVDLGTAKSPGRDTLNINSTGAFISNTTGNAIAALGDTFLVNGVQLAPDSLSGIAFEDFNDDGQVDFGEHGIAGVAVTLTGTDFLGNAVNVPATTDSDGAYIFANLLPGNYTIREAQPTGYLQGIDSIGTAGGSLSPTDQFFVQLAQDQSGVNGLNYNFGEQPTATGSVKKGQTAGIGFWNNKNGQALIKALPVVTNTDGSVTSVGNWLAATLPHMFGADAGNNDLTGKSNAFVAALFQQDFLLKGVKLDAQVLATALSVYATNATLDSTGVAAKYGFTVSGDGLGTAAVNVGTNGDAFGVANNSTLTVIDLLLATDAQAVNGLLYNGNTTKRNEANTVFSALNQAGGIG